MATTYKFKKQTPTVVTFDTESAEYPYRCTREIKPEQCVRYERDGQILVSFVFSYENQLVTKDLEPVKDLMLTQEKIQHLPNLEADTGSFISATRLRKLALLVA